MDQDQRYTLDDFGTADPKCNMIEMVGMFAFKALFDASNGDPCDGCAFRSNCKFLKKKETENKQKRAVNFGKVSFKTNAETAKELGISKRQVSKMNKAKRHGIDNF